MKQFLPRPVSTALSRARVLADLIGERMAAENLLDTAASLTFTTLLALVPLVTIALTVFSAFPAFASFTAHIKEFLLSNLVPEAATRLITVYGRQFVDNAARLTAFGIIGLGITAVLVMHTILGSFNHIWRVRRPRPLPIRIALYWAVLTVGPILIGGSLSLTSWLFTLSEDLTGVAPGINGMLLKAGPFLLTTLALAFIYNVVPNRSVAMGDALIGGVLAAIVFEAVKVGFSQYLALFPTYTLVYGTFAGVPAFLLWIYLSWLIVLVGAVVVAVLPDWRAGAQAGQRHTGHRFYRVLAVLRELAIAHRSGEVLPTLRLQKVAGLGIADTEALLVELSGHGWVVEAVGGGWALGRDSSEITLADVFERFVFAPLDGPVPPALASVQHPLAHLEAGMSRELAISLEELFLLEPRTGNVNGEASRSGEERAVVA